MRVLIFSFFLFSGISAWGQFDHSHRLWDALIKSHVVIKNKASAIDYGKILELENNMKKSGKVGPLSQYLSRLSQVRQKDYDSWTEMQKLAFLVNAYNAFTVKLIIDNYPKKKEDISKFSIRDIKEGLFGTTGPWKIEFFTLLGEKRHLDWVEHTIIRKKFNEPEIHFALVCAAQSCPSLRNEAFVASRIKEQFKEQGKIFLTDPLKNRIENNNGKVTLKLSKIFDWYGHDFNKTYGSYHKYISQYITEDKDIRSKIANKKVEVDSLTYYWDINDTKTLDSWFKKKHD